VRQGLNLDNLCPLLTKNNNMDNSVIFALMNMPITYSALVIENTSRCNAKCGMCYQSAGPKGSDQIGDNTIDNDILKKVLSDALNIKSLNRRFHLSGGEAFLNIESAIDLFSYAKMIGYEEITAVSNGYWAKNKIKGLGVAQKLRDSGLTTLEISWDYWHFEHISNEAVGNCIDVCYDVGIETNLRLLATKKHTHLEALNELKISSLNKVDRISCCPVFPTGRADLTIPKSEVYFDDNIYGSCHTTLNLTINANGNVYPCCAGIDQTENYLFGNIKNTPISIIAERMNSSPMLRTIVFYGISALIPILKENGVKIDEKCYANICTMCWSIFSNEKYVQIISEYFDNATKRAIENLTHI
jgi:MoaA/NifB/PqqE/SkfB family radical SAM enzyme